MRYLAFFILLVNAATAAEVTLYRWSGALNAPSLKKLRQSESCRMLDFTGLERGSAYLPHRLWSTAWT